MGIVDLILPGSTSTDQSHEPPAAPKAAESYMARHADVQGPVMSRSRWTSLRSLKPGQRPQRLMCRVPRHTSF